MFTFTLAHQTTHIPQTAVHSMQSTDAQATDGPSSTTLKHALGKFKITMKTTSGTSLFVR